MDIVHIGHSAFKIRSKKATLVTDPYDSQMTGLKFPKTEADIVTVSHHHHDHDYIEAITSEKIVIDGPGEYEIKGIKITGIQSFHDTLNGSERGKNTIYKIEADNVTIAHLGDLGHKLNDQLIEQLNGVDILLIPVGGFFSLDPNTASVIINSLEPSIIIPMHYLTDNLNKENFGKLVPVSEFLKVMGKESISSIPKLSITKDKLNSEPQIIVLE